MNLVEEFSFCRFKIYFSPTKSDTSTSHRENLDREKSKMSNVVVESNKTDDADKTMSPKSTTTTVTNKSISSSQRYHVTRVEENVHLTRKYRIKWAVDPSNGRKYSLDEIVQSSLIDKTMRMFFVPSTRQLLDLDEAIRSGIVFAELIDEFIEASNESFEYVEEKKSSSLSTLRFVDVVHKKVRYIYSVVIVGSVARFLFGDISRLIISITLFGA